jgi:large subunit ribosomal protein L9
MATPIRVVLQEDVDSLGSSGDVVRVRPGFARNFLIPRGLAVPATEGNLSRVDELRRVAAARKAKEKNEALELAKKLQSVSVKIARAVGDDNKMFGSVTSKDIAEAYEAAGVSLDRKRIHLSEPIKTLGLTEVETRLYPDVVATLRVEVVKQS